MDILNKTIQFFTRVKNWLIGGFTSKKVNIVLNDNHSASKLEQFKELYQEFSSICDNAYELSNLGLEVDLTKYINKRIELDLSKFKIEQIKLDLEEFTRKEQRRFHDEMLVRIQHDATKCKENLMYQEERSFYRDFFSNPQYNINRFANPPTFNWNSDTIFRPYYEDNELHRLASKTPMNDNDIEEMKRLLKCKDNVNMLGSNGDTPLYRAILRENLPAIKLLLVYDAGLFLKNNEGHTPYQLALKNELIQDLFDNDPSVKKNVRIQKFNYNIDQLYLKKEIELQIGPITTYKKISSSIDGPVKTLKEITVEKILHSIAKG